jgi:hypothetical protein
MVLLNLLPSVMLLNTEKLKVQHLHTIQSSTIINFHNLGEKGVVKFPVAVSKISEWIRKLAH